MNATPSRLNRTPEEATAIVKFHASLNVSNLSRSVEFYTALFGLEPVKLYPDYAKFELNEPAIRQPQSSAKLSPFHQPKSLLAHGASCDLNPAGLKKQRYAQKTEISQRQTHQPATARALRR